MKKCDKFKHPLVIFEKVLLNWKIEGNFLNTAKYVYKKSIDYFRLYGERLQTSLLKSGTSEG